MEFPHGAVASGWIPFGIFLLLTLVFSWFYIRYFQSRYDSELSSTLTAICALTVALLTILLVPVDIFLVSFMKDANGNFKDWANDSSIRQSIEDSVLYGYYSLYGCLLVFMFLIIPFIYFYYEEKEDDWSVGMRMCSAFKYTAVFLVIASVLLILGAFIPLKEQIPKNGTEWQKLEFLVEELGKNKGEDALSFVISILSMIGMIALVFYTGYGMSAYPCGLIKGSRSAQSEHEEIIDRKIVILAKINALRDQYRNGRTMSPRDRRKLEELEEEERLMQRQERHLENTYKNWLNKCLLVFRPFEIFFGILLLLLGLLIFISLLLTNIDKALHSLGPKMGYLLPERKLPNPIDIVFVYAQMVFPLDYILFVGVVLFLFVCSMAAIRQVGIWFLWVRMYRIRPHRTRPQGLLLMCMTLMMIILAMNIMVYSFTPQYAMYGSQHYQANKTDTKYGNITTELVPCSTDAPEGECIISRMTSLLIRFFYKAWFFGAFYYWATWAFLVVVVIGAVVSILKRPSSSIEGAVHRDDFDDSDDDDMISA